ncbi:MAG: alpha/beta hydrolase, partial [Clostridiales bacterium]|nr:alpha/beta hydrolase [Clostridiales bacterium]
MNKVIKVISGIGKGLLILLSVLAVFLIVMTVINRIMLKKEAAVFDKPIGQMVEVDDHNMCVYTEGEGDHTIVFLSGSSIPSPILDYKPLYSRLTDDYRIVVIEKFGYGYSDVVDSERSFETMLRQDREALASLGIEGPFILCPHSMSGLEALMWAQDYPEEVEAIVGLDMTVPETYDDFAERLEDMKSTKWI